MHLSRMSEVSTSTSLLASAKYYTEIDNIAELPYNDRERIVGFMRTRFLNSRYYTWAGNVLLSIQTCKDLNSSTHEDSSDYTPSSYENYTAPSVQAVVDRLWFRLHHNIGKSDQAIVVSGESGSGKTYSICLAIKGIANKADIDREGQKVLWQVWASVPLLSAFGNAPTALNRNSSRFGKLLRLQYVNDRLRGAMVDTYLIEKSRVANVNPGEGNFHIFRQVIDSLDDDTLKAMRLSKTINYRIAPKIGLKSTYTETVNSMEILKIFDMEYVLIILSAILNLGNITFIENSNACHGDGSDGSFTVHSDCRQFLENVCELFHMSPQVLIELLCMNQFSASVARRETVYKSPCNNIQECEARRDSIMKHLYERLFCWLVDSINFRIFRGHVDKYINLIDLYGFEVFEYNSFEQLCINYANERLQQYFHKSYLAAERNDLLNDGFEIDDMSGDEYIERISLLDGPISIFSILNEECAMKRFKNDMYLTSRFRQTIKDNKYFLVTDEFAANFCIRHYAGVVKYHSATMITKNRDKVPKDIVDALRQSDFNFLRILLENDDKIDSMKRTVLSYFKKSVDELVTILDSCDVHYIKCLKVNNYKIPDFFDDDYFAHQLLSNGVMDILKLSFQHYSIKVPLDQFVKRVGRPLFNALRKPLATDMHIGLQKIYMTDYCFTTFERFNKLRFERAARILQKYWMRLVEHRNHAAQVIQRFIRQKLFTRKSSINKCINRCEIYSGSPTVEDMCYLLWTRSTKLKIEEYLIKNMVEFNFEGAPLSLQLERTYNQLKTKRFHRVLFCGNRVVSYHKLAEIPVRFHVSKTCIRNSHLLPKSEMSQGLADIFS